MRSEERENGNYYKLSRVHKYYLKTGLYKLIFKNLAIISIVIVFFIAILFVVDRYFLEFGPFFEKNIHKLNMFGVLTLFFISESILGIIPPDIFIIWSESLDYPFPALGALAILSYIGGFVAYNIGFLLRKLPRVYKLIKKRFYKQENFVKKWGGVFIVISALLPFPYAVVCTVCGMTSYPRKRLLLLGLTRIARFLIYSVFLYRMFNFEAY